LQRSADIAYIACNVATIDPEEERRRLAGTYAEMGEGELEKLADEAWSLTELARGALEAELSRRALEITLRNSSEADPQRPGPVTLRRFRDLPDASAGQEHS
jgi:hypothetical protein